MRRAVEISLDSQRREKLQTLSRSGRTPVRLVQRAKILLLAAEGRENTEIAQCLNISRHKAARWRERFAQWGLAGIEKDAPRPGRIPSISKRQKANIVRKTMEETPPHATHWSRASMAAVTGVSESTIGRIWRQHGLKPHRHKTSSFPMIPSLSPSSKM